jgi:hypothetical protein
MKASTMLKNTPTVIITCSYRRVAILTLKFYYYYYLVIFGRAGLPGLVFDVYQDVSKPCSHPSHSCGDRRCIYFWCLRSVMEIRFLEIEP